MRPSGRLVGVVLVAAMGAASSAPDTAGRAAMELALEAYSKCPGEDCKDFAPDLWAARKRVATKEELRSMAVQLEQGDEACLCGKTNPTVTAIERQAQLLAEAVVLYRLCGDEDGAKFCLNRLRNVSAKEPENPAVMELLVRASAFLGGAEQGVREASAVKPEAARAGVVVGAAETRGLDDGVRAAMVKAVMGSVESAEGKLAVIRGLERAGDGDSAQAFVDAIPAAQRGRYTTALLKMRRMAVKAVEKGPEAQAAAEKRLNEAVAGGGAKEMAAAISRAAEDAAAAGMGLPRVKELAPKLETPAERMAFLVGAAKGFTRGSDRVRFEDMLVVHGGT